MAQIIDIATAPVNGSAETQRLAVSGGTPVSGNIVAGYKNHRITVPYNATATQVRDALRGLNEIGPTGVNGSGGPLPGTPVDIAFASNLANANVPQMTIISHTLSVGTPAITTTVAGADASPRGMSMGTVVCAKDTGKLYVNMGTPNAPSWRLLVPAPAVAIAALLGTTGTADGTMDDVGGAFSQATLNNNFKELSTKVNALIALLS